MSRFQEIWETFRREGTVTDHWTRRGQAWADSSHFLGYLIPLVTNRSAVVAAQAIQAELAFRFVDLVAAESLHVTVQEVGFEEEISPERAEALVSEARRALRDVEPFMLRISGANSFAGSAFLEVHDSGELLKIRSRLREALPWLAEPGRRPVIRESAESFVPHVSIAYYNARQDNRPVVEVLERFRPLDAGKVWVESLDLVRTPKPAGHYRWTRVARLRLGG